MEIDKIFVLNKSAKNKLKSALPFKEIIYLNLSSENQISEYDGSLTIFPRNHIMAFKHRELLTKAFSLGEKHFAKMMNPFTNQKLKISEKEFDLSLAELLQNQSRLLEGSRFSLQCEKDSNNEIFEELIRLMGGETVDLVKGNPDFVLGDWSFFYSNIAHFKETKIKVLDKEWLYQTFNNGTSAKMDDFEIHMPLHQKSICVTGIMAEERQRLSSIITQNGGTYMKNLRKNCTHLLATEAKGPKYQFAKKHGIRIYKPEFIDFFLSKKGILTPNELETYRLKEKPLSLETKSAQSPNSIEKLKEENKKEGEKLGLLCQNLLKRNEDERNKNCQRKKIKNLRKISKDANLNLRKNEEISNPSAKRKPKEIDKENLVDRKKRKNVLFGIDWSVDDMDYLTEVAVYFVGIAGKMFLKAKEVVRVSGATRFPYICRDVTHVVVSASKHTEKRIEKISKDFNIPIVTIDWLFDCYKQRKEVDIENYLWGENNFKGKLLDFGRLQIDLEKKANLKTGNVGGKLKVFMLSGFEASKRKRLKNDIEKLDAGVIANYETAEKMSTHFICDSIENMNLDLAYALMAKNWILKELFIIESVRKKCFLPENSFQFGLSPDSSVAEKRFYKRSLAFKEENPHVFLGRSYFIDNGVGRGLKQKLEVVLKLGGAKKVFRKLEKDGFEEITHVVIEKLGDFETEMRERLMRKVMNIEKIHFVTKEDICREIVNCDF